MLPSDAIAEAGKDVASDKVQELQTKGSDESAEDGGEATSSSSMKSPVTPGAVCESNGTPALRWKSYTKQKESGSNGKPPSQAGASAAVADSKGKLVINLCGIPRSLIKKPSPATEVKAATAQDMDTRKSDAASTSSQDPASHCNLDDDEDRGHQNLHAGSSDESVPRHEHDLDLEPLKLQSKASELAKKVCRRIRMVRRTLKASKRPSTRRCTLKASSKEEKISQSRRKSGVEIKGSSQPGNDGDIFKSKRSSMDQLMNGRVEEHEEVTGSEDLIYSDGETFSQRNEVEGYVEHDVERSRGRFTPVLAKEQQLELKKEVPAKDFSNAFVGQMSADATLAEAPHGQMPMSECNPRDAGAKDQVCGKRQARSLSHDAGAFSETSKLEDVKEQTVLETLLRDEAPGYSSGGGSEQSRDLKAEGLGGIEYPRRASLVAKRSQSDDTEGSDEESYEDDEGGSESDGYDDDDDSLSTESHEHECEDGDCNCGGVSPGLHGAPRRGVAVTEQVPSVLCDAEGNVWHIGKRAEQARGKALAGQLLSTGEVLKKIPSFARTSYPAVVQELDSNEASGSSVAPYSQQIEFNWKWPSDADYSISSVGDVSNRSMVFKEKAIFVGCIPDGTENLEDVLQGLMEKFLERFDFAPALLGQIQLVKIVKDFAFLELATEKLAHIVLAANQLDVFEWGVNGFHFNIEGCKGTHTSVRPLIEYMPLKPARVLFLGNVPKSRWQRDYLEVFFTRILKGADRPADCKFVNHVYLLPESCDAYVELASEIMADAIVFKCIKNPQILKEIGEDVFICRDPSSVPLMSKHQGIVCPQRSLFIGVSSPGQEFKIDSVRKIFEDLLLIIARETSQAGYLEFISVQPGKDYAFFQFNSESIVDAVMEEYIKNTHLFICGSNLLSYIILRPPGYERPGARYRSQVNRMAGSRSITYHSKNHLSKFESHATLLSTKKSKSKAPNHPGSVPLVPRRFGDEPAKKTDCVMSIGVSPLPKATWNGLSSKGACAADPECMLVIKGLPRGFTFKLLRGALNELFERSLSHTGLLEIGMLVLRHLDKDSSLGVVASLPNAKFVNALLLLRKPLAIAGSELRLLPACGRRRVTWKGGIAEHGRVQGDVSCLSDDDVYHDELTKRHFKDTKNAPSFTRKHDGRHIIVHSQGGKNLATRRNRFKLDQEVQCEESLKHILPSPKKLCRSDANGVVRAANGFWKAPTTGLKGKYLSKPTTLTQWNGSILKSTVLHATNVKGPLKLRKRGVEHLSEGRSNSEESPEEILHIVSEGGKRKIQTVGTTSKVERGLGRAGVVTAVSRKRKFLQLGQDSSALRAAFIQKNFKKLRRISRVL